MLTFPVTLILIASATIGTILLLNYFKGIRKPLLTGAHLILGAAALEQMAMLLRGAPNGDSVPFEPLAKTVAGLLAVAMGLGFATPLMRNSRQTMNLMLTGHVVVAVSACLLFLVWVARL